MALVICAQAKAPSPASSLASTASALLFKLYQFFPVMPPQCLLYELWLKEL